LQPNIVEKERPKLSPLPQQQAKVEKIAEKEKPIEKPLVKPEPDKAKVVEKKSELQPIKPNPEPQKTAKANEPKPNAETTASKVETKKTETKPVESQKNNVQEVEKKKHEPQKTETKPDEVVTEKSDAKQEQSVPAKAEVKKTEEKPTNTEELSPDDRDRRIAAALARIQAQTQAQGKPSLSEEEKGTGPVTKGGEFGEGGGGVVRGVEFLIYTQQLQKRVQENWIVAEKKPGLVASVSFMIEPNGNVQEFEMTQSSGDSAFDQSVMRAIRKAAPFPPPPQSYVQEFATQKIVMNFGGEGRVN
jgi:TolA protein